MDVRIARQAQADERATVRWLDGEGRADEYCVLLVDEAPRWQVAIKWRCPSLPFQEALVWHEAGIAVIGGSDEVRGVDLATGAPRLAVDVAGYFGHLALGSDTLYILGCNDVQCLDATLRLRWRSKQVAVDGVVFVREDEATVVVHAEMDPPGGWFAVTLDRATGRELSRIPAFTPGYVGLYGSAPDEA